MLCVLLAEISAFLGASLRYQAAPSDLPKNETRQVMNQARQAFHQASAQVEVSEVEKIDSCHE
jgi:hypothetical protein